VARSCERAAADPPGRRQRDHEQESQSKLGALVDEGIREAARGSVRFEEIGA
jgi:hypothetical protein